MSFQDLKAGFKSYLLEQLYGNNPNQTISDSELLSYGEEFREYISKNTTYNTDLFSTNYNDISDFELVNGQLVLKDNDGLFSDNDNGMRMMSDALNDLFKDEEFITSLDSNNNGVLDKKEVSNFISFMNSEDKDLSKLSFGDLCNGVSKVKSGQYDAKNIESVLAELSNALGLGDNILTSGSSEVAGIEGVETIGDIQDGSIESGPDTPDNDDPTIRIAGVTSYAQMSEEELQKKLEEKQAKVEEKQAALENVYNGTDSGLKVRQDSIDHWNEVLHNQLERKEIKEELVQQFDAKVAEIDGKKGEIDAKSLEISNQELTVTNSETAYQNAISTRSNLESALASLSSYDTSNLEDDEAASIQAQIAELTAAVQSAIQAEEQAKTTLEEEKAKLETYKGEKTTLEGELGELEGQKTEIEQQMIAINPEVQYALKEYNNAVQKYDAYKVTAAQRAQVGITEAQEGVTEIQGIIQDNRNREDTLNYTTNFMGKEIVQLAKEFLGYNEADCSADMFLHKWKGSSSQIGWCSAFVDYVLDNIQSTDKLPEWYTNIENRYWQVNIEREAEKAGAVIEASQAQSGDIVLFDYEGDSQSNHIGIIVAVEGDKLITIEGNSGNVVKMNEFDLNNPGVKAGIKFVKVTP